MTDETVSVAEAKKHFSELLGRVAYRGQSILITKRGRPMARLVPSSEREDKPPRVEGWLEADDPFFEVMDGIVADRETHLPRVFGGEEKEG